MYNVASFPSFVVDTCYDTENGTGKLTMITNEIMMMLMTMGMSGMKSDGD